jgi:peptide deformylase
MTLDVVTYGVPVLRERAIPVTSFDGGIKNLADDMLETMYGCSGLGLAAEQIGKTTAVCVVDVPPERLVEDDPAFVESGIPMPLVMINPEIIDRGGSEVREEGCLSFPEIYAPIKRATEVEVVYSDLKGEKHSLSAKGLLARAIQHELDHLSGVLIVDRMSAVKRIGLAGQLKRLRQETESRTAKRME